MKDLNYYQQIKYPLTILQEDDGSYFAEYPDLKGCMTVADTFEEIHEMAEDAKLAWLETAVDNNTSIPEPKKVASYSGNFKLRIPKSLHKQLADEAKLEGVSMNQLCVYLLSKELDHQHSA